VNEKVREFLIVDNKAETILIAARKGSGLDDPCIVELVFLHPAAESGHEDAEEGEALVVQILIEAEKKTGAVVMLGVGLAGDECGLAIHVIQRVGIGPRVIKTADRVEVITS